MPSDGIAKETPETTKEQARPDNAAAKAQERAEKVDRSRTKENLPSRLREGLGVDLSTKSKA